MAKVFGVQLTKAELLARVRAMLRRKDHFTPDLLPGGGPGPGDAGL